MARYLPLAFLLLLFAGCAEPFIVFSGDALTGTLTPPPSDWTALNDVDVVQFETRPADPYSINIWAAGIGPHIYIATSEGGTRWTEHLDQSRDVRLKINGAIYELKAFSVRDQQEREVVAAEYVRKYDVDEDDNWVADGQIYRLDRR